MKLLGRTRRKLAALAEMEHQLARIEHQLAELQGRTSERCCAVNVGNNRLLVKAFVEGITLAFLVQADDRLIVPQFVVHGHHELNISKYLARTIRQTDHVLDVGANFGYFTCIAARLTSQGKTVGIEPDLEVYGLLRDNISINSLEGVASPIHAAVGERAGLLTLNRRPTRSGNTSIIKVSKDYSRSKGEPESEPFDVQAITIDSLLPELDNRVDLMKVDVEGAEPLALRGAGLTIEQNPQLRIVMEWAPAQISAAGFDIGEFVKDLQRLEFAISVPTFDGDLWHLSPAELLNQSYHSGVLLRRQS